MSARRRVLVAMLALPLAGCIILPIPHTEIVSPEVHGTLVRSDGTPAAGLAVAATGDDGDRSCTQAGTHAVTDSAGHFTLLAGRVHRSTTVVTLMESFGAMSYWLCAGPVDSSSAAPPARQVVHGNVRGSWVECQLWQLDSMPHLTCGYRGVPFGYASAPGVSHAQVFSGGSWQDGPSRGAYRLVFESPDLWGRRGARAYLLWTTRGAGESEQVCAATQLPAGAKLDAFDGARFENREGRWFVVVDRLRRSLLSRSLPYTFALGAPGQVQIQGETPGGH